jgi:hypothetical protein
MTRSLSTQHRRRISIGRKRYLSQHKGLTWKPKNEAVWKANLRTSMLESASRGESHYRAKLTAEAVRIIRKFIQTSKSDASIGQMFGVGRGAIRAIRLGKTWKHVKEESCDHESRKVIGFSEYRNKRQQENQCPLSL